MYGEAWADSDATTRIAKLEQAWYYVQIYPEPRGAVQDSDQLLLGRESEGDEHMPHMLLGDDGLQRLQTAQEGEAVLGHIVEEAHHRQPELAAVGKDTRKRLPGVAGTNYDGGLGNYAARPRLPQARIGEGTVDHDQEATDHAQSQVTVGGAPGEKSDGKRAKANRGQQPAEVIAQSKREPAGLVNQALKSQ